MFVSTKSWTHPYGQDIYVHILELLGIRVLRSSPRIMAKIGRGPSVILRQLVPCLSLIMAHVSLVD